MTDPEETTKPGHHRVDTSIVVAWQRETGEADGKLCCAYCDENVLNDGMMQGGKRGCSSSCGYGYVWVDTVTLAKINLEGAKP
jgi:hypothetical protein